MARASLLRHVLCGLALVGTGSLTSVPAVAQSSRAEEYVVTYVRGAVERSGRRLRTGDRLGAADRVRFTAAADLVVVASPAGQFVLQAAGPRRGNPRASAAALYVRDLLAPALDRATLSTRGPNRPFSTADALRRGLGDGRWVVIGPQNLPVPFAERADRFEVRYVGTSESPPQVARRLLPVVDSRLTLSHEALGPACSDPSAGEPVLAWLVHLTEAGAEAVVTAPLWFVCPDEFEVRGALQILAEVMGTAAAGRLAGAETFVTAAFGPTYLPALRAWTDTP